MGRSALQVAFVVISAAGCVTIMCVVSLSSLDVMRLLLWNHEFWFNSVVNAGHSILIGDIRASVGFASWLAFQSIIMIDASILTFPSATKSVVSVIPAVVGLLVLDKIRDMNHVVSQVKRLRVNGPDVLIFTSTS